MAWAGYMINNGEEERGFRLATTNSLALTAGMGYRFYKHPRVFPAGACGRAGARTTPLRDSETVGTGDPCLRHGMRRVCILA